MIIFGLKPKFTFCLIIAGLLFIASCQDEGVEEKETDPINNTPFLSITEPADGGTFSSAPAIKVDLANWDLRRVDNGMAYSLNGEDPVEIEKRELQLFPNQAGQHTVVVFLTDGKMVPVAGAADTITYNIEENTNLYKLTIENGAGSWHFERGQTTWLRSQLESPFVFSHWAGDNGVLADSTADPVTFKMPPANVTLKATGKAEGVSFSQHLFPLMEAKCNSSGCHDASSFPAYTTYETIKESGENIVQKTQNRQMPPPRHSTLTEEEIEIFRVWVEEGMKNN